jgi:RimJ/RimL family protein N-acetyltransferase/acyl carrier protein
LIRAEVRRRLATDRVCLRAVEPTDYPFIKDLELTPPRLVAYRHRGSTPAPEAFAQRLWHGVLAQFLAVAVADGRPLGLVAAYSADYRNANAQIAVVAVGEEDPDAALVIEATELFVDFLFDAFNFNKLYAYVLEVNYPRFARLVGPVVSLEGVLRGHEFFEGRWVDTCILAVHRDAWDSRPPEWSTNGLKALLGPDLVEPDGFAAAVAELLDLDYPPGVDPFGLVLVDDLAVDSIGILQLIDVIEGSWAGELPAQALAAMATLGDAYHFHCAIRERFAADTGGHLGTG